MANRWTDEQLAAIQTRGANLLVSAAAGSGKTAVLVERIIEKITDEAHPVDIDRLLVVTFTNAAAAEMRERITAAIAAKLEENPSSESLARQMTLAAKASITTIHSFCLDTLRTNFSAAGIDPNFRIADSTENELLRLEALDEVMDEMFEDEELGEAFTCLLENYSSVKSRAGFDELIQTIYHFVMSLPDPEGWLTKAAERFSCGEGQFASSELANMIVEMAKDRVREIMARYDDLLEKARLDDGGDGVFLLLASERECLSHLLNIDRYDEACEWAASMTFARFPAAPKNSEPVYRESIKNTRAKAKEDFQKKVSGGLLMLSAQEQERVMRVFFPQMRCLSEVVRRLIARFDEKKAEKNLLNFNDLEHGCYRLLTDGEGGPTELARTIGGRFEEILIDEYQDTSRLQEAIFSAIKKENNLFMVGDIKQSIYRFRNTDPSLFREKKERFSAEEGARDRKIVLSKNFRSRSEILAGINTVFKRLMSASAGEIEYNEEEELYPGSEYPECPHPLTADLQLHVIDGTQEAEQSGEDTEDAAPAGQIEREARLAAEQIGELLSGGYQVLTKGGYRTITYRDICILLRKTKDWAEIFLQTLSEYGIPCYCETGGGFLQSAEVETMLSLLKIIDNPYQDLPLLSVMRSQMFVFTTNDLAQIRIADKKGSFYDAVTAKAEDGSELGSRAAGFVSCLLKFREMAQYLPLDELIWTLYRETGFYDAQSTLQGGLLRQSNLRLLAMRAKEYEKTSFRGLYSFVRFIDNYRAAGGDYDAARSIGEEQDVVRIMSIHKSKGLEFPVVLLCGVGKQMNRQDLVKNVLIHPTLGYGPKFIDPDLRITYPTAVRTAVKEHLEREMLSEEMRILYVALTRAREKLIVIGSCADVGKRTYTLGAAARGKDRLPPYCVLAARSYLDWFFLALFNHPSCGPLRDSVDYPVRLSSDTSPWAVVLHSDVTEERGRTEEKTDKIVRGEEGAPSELFRLMDFAYPYLQDETLPVKITVTELKNKRLREEDDGGVYLYPRPKFLQQGRSGKLSAAARGTAFHTVMQRLDFSEVSQEGIIGQIAHLVQSGFLTPEEADCVDVGKIRRFFASETGSLLLSAERVEREVMFGISIPAGEAEPDYHGDAQIMLQGVIDCVVIHQGKITILDYKTEHVASADAVREKYRIQLDYYARAAEKIYGLEVTRRILYLFETGNTLEM